MAGALDVLSALEGTLRVGQLVRVVGLLGTHSVNGCCGTLQHVFGYTVIVDLGDHGKHVILRRNVALLAEDE